MKPPIIYLFVQHTWPEFPSILPNRVHFRYIQQHRRGLRAHWSTYVLSDTLAFTALQTVRRGKLSLIRIENHKEQSLNCCTWLVWVFSMAPHVPTAGRCLLHRDKKSCILRKSPGLLRLSQATVCLGFFLTIPPRGSLHSRYERSLKLHSWMAL